MSISRFNRPRLRTVEQEGKRTATWLELFYDLAFVVGVAVLGDRLLADPSGIASYFGYFTLLWWQWASHTFYADRYDTDDIVYRLLAGAQMVAIVVIAASLTGATSSTLAFAIGYAGARWVLVLMYARVHRHVLEARPLVRGYLIGFGLAAAVWTVSTVVPESTRVVVWAVAFTIDLATPWVMRSEQARVPLDVSHLPERFGLFTILVLGEAIAAVVGGLAHDVWSVNGVIVASMAVAVATSIWWMYFDTATGSVVRRSPAVRRTWRPTAWIYTHLPLAASLGVLGVGLELAIFDIGAAMPPSDRWLLVGSTAVALLSMASIQYSSYSGASTRRSRDVAVNRLAGIPFLIAIGLVGNAGASWIIAAVLAVCLAEVVADFSAIGRDQREPTPA